MISGGATLASTVSSLNQSFNNLVITSNSWLTLSNGPYSSYATILTVLTNATIQAGGGISLDGKGYPPGQGPGAGSSTFGTGGSVASGGGYGGYGVYGGGGYGYYGRPRYYGGYGGYGRRW